MGGRDAQLWSGEGGQVSFGFYKREAYGELFSLLGLVSLDPLQ